MSFQRHKFYSESPYKKPRIFYRNVLNVLKTIQVHILLINENREKMMVPFIRRKCTKSSNKSLMKYNYLNNFLYFQRKEKTIL